VPTLMVCATEGAEARNSGLRPREVRALPIGSVLPGHTSQAYEPTLELLRSLRPSFMLSPVASLHGLADHQHRPRSGRWCQHVGVSQRSTPSRARGGLL